MVVFYILVLIVAGGYLIHTFRSSRKNREDEYTEQTEYSSSPSYPYRPDVEFRLPDGRITTKGYAASHPSEFAHWRQGPENVYGEYIDRKDWEDWRANYYGD